MGDLSVWAAWAAALTSMATLIVTTVVGGRRDQRRWARDALTDAFVAFLEASWQHSDLFREQSEQGAHPPTGAADAYDEMRSQLTRLRLLASGSALGACEELLRRQKVLREAAPGAARQAALTRASQARRAVVVAAKTEMGLS
jgi:heme exporter protein D